MADELAVFLRNAQCDEARDWCFENGAEVKFTEFRAIFAQAGVDALLHLLRRLKRDIDRNRLSHVPRALLAAVRESVGSEPNENDAQLAQQLVLDACEEKPWLSARNLAELIEIFALPFDAESEVFVRVVRATKSLLQHGAIGDAVDMVRWMPDSLLLEITPEELVRPCIKKRRFLDGLLAVLGAKDDPVVEQHCDSFRRELIRQAADRNGGKDPTYALNLVTRFGFSFDSFPRVLYLKRKQLVWWTIRENIFDDFADLIIPEAQSDENYKLRWYACQQMQKRGMDIEKYLLQYDLADDPFFARRTPVADKNSVSNESDGDGSESTTTTDDSDPYLTIDVPIHVVDDFSSAKKLSNALANARIVGMDAERVNEQLLPLCEHKQVLSMDLSMASQWLQISTETECFLVDLPKIRSTHVAVSHNECTLEDLENELDDFDSLSDVESQDDTDVTAFNVFDTALSDLFQNEAITKAGMDFGNDLRELLKDIPELLCLRTPVVNYCELLSVLQRLPRRKKISQADKYKPKTRGDFVANSSQNLVAQSSTGGLSHLVHCFLGKHLDKRERMSNWALRPLRPSQQEYAALDALCCVQIVQRLASQEHNYNEVLPPFETLCSDLFAT
ncbi:MAG: hypothetical protein MHM6MM_001068 [Cercozoa sp. M6MM]